MGNKRVKKAYRLLGIGLIAELLIVFLNSGTVQGINHRADNLKVYAAAEREDKEILPGNIYDCNENEIVVTDYQTITESTEKGETERTVRTTTYAHGKAYSQLVGYTGTRELNPLADNTEDVVGNRRDYRLMAYLDETAWGENGLYSTVDADGTRGQSAVLTIDSTLQEYVYGVLSQEMSDSGEIGSAVVMDAKTGKILSMVSFPTYDFNNLAEARQQMMYDEENTNLEPGFPVTYKNSETPGSIFKVLIAVALIDHDMEDFKVVNVPYTVAGWTCQTYAYQSPTLSVGIDEEIDLETALNISSNVYFSQAALALGADRIRETAEKFHLIENSFVDENQDGKDDRDGHLEEEDQTYLELDFGNVEYNWDLAVEDDVLAQTGFGQGRTELTTVYAAMITQAIANDGKMMKPYVIEKLVDANGKAVYEGEETSLGKATSSATAHKVAEAMRSTAVECCNLHNLSSVKSVFDKYQVAGKTGTAENGDKEDTTNAWYISFAPADDPQYVVVVNQCKTHKSGYRMMSAVANIYSYLFENF